MKTIKVFDPVSVPCRGMATTVDAVALSPGQYALLQNVRIDSMVFKVRDGAADLSATGLPNGWCVGCFQAALNGTDYVFVAVDTGASIRVYASTGTAFTEWTATGAGSYNETRFVTGLTTNNYNAVTFVVVKAPTRADSGVLSTDADTDLLLCSDGNKVLVSNVARASLRPCPRLAASTDFAKFRQEATFPDFMPITSGIASFNEDGSGDVTGSTGSTWSATGGTAPKMTFATTTDANDYGEWRWTAANNMAAGPCMVLMYACSDDTFWDYIKVSIYDSTAAAYKVVWDPSSTTTTTNKPAVITVDATADVHMAVFPLDPATQPSADNYQRLQFMYVGTSNALASATDVFLLGWYTGGKVPGSAQFSVTYYSSNGFTESEPHKCMDLGGVKTGLLGMTDAKNQFEIPVNVYCTYSYRITYQASTEVGNGVDYALVYCQFFDTNGYRPDAYYLIGQDQFGQFSAGSWTYVSGYSSGGLQTVSINTSVLLPRQATKPFHRPPMPFKAAFWTDGRLLLGGVKKDDSATVFGGFFASSKGDPFDFSEFERFDANGNLDLTGPVIVPLGGEIPQAIAGFSNTRSELEVSAPAGIVTDRGAWAVDTSTALTLLRPQYLCPFGTKAPASVVSGGGAIYWFDVSRNIRKAFQTVDSPSLWRVDSLWIGIPSSTTRTGSNPQTRPRDQRVSCAYFKDKLYVAYTPTGQAYNVACSVYDTIRDVWYDDSLGVNFERLFTWPVVGNVPQLRAFSVGDDTDSGGGTFSSAPLLYQHEQSGQATDAGTDIVINVQTGYLHFSAPDEGFKNASWQQVGIVADKSSSQSLSVVKTVYPGNESATGTIDMSTGVSGNQLVRWEVNASDSGNKPHLAAGVACQISVQGTYAPGKRIMAVYVRADARETGTGVKQT